MIRLATVPRRVRAAGLAAAGIALLAAAPGLASEAPDLAPGAVATGTAGALDAPSADAAADEARAANLAEWRGRVCLSPACKRTPAARAADTLAFGGAIVTVAWIARRRASQRG